MDVKLRLGRQDGDLRYTSFLGRVQNVVLELAAMADYQVSRERSVPLDRPYEAQSQPEVSSAPAEMPGSTASPSRPTGLRLIPTFRVSSGGPDPHFEASASIVPGLEGFFRLVFRPESGHVFVACYLVGRPPFLSPPGVVNCYHLRCHRIGTSNPVNELARTIIRDEVLALTQDLKGPHRPSLDNLGPIMTELDKEVGDQVGKLTHKFHEGRLQFDLDVRKATSSDRRVRKSLVGLIGEIESLIPSLRGRPPRVDPDQTRARYAEILASCTKLLDRLKGRRWPPVNRDAAAALLLRQSFPLAEDEIAAIAPLLRKGRRRPVPRALAIRMLAQLTGVSERQIYDLVLK